MFLLESKWLTFWTLEYTLIWLGTMGAMGAMGTMGAMGSKIDFIKKFMNPYYLLLIIAFGRLGIIMYQYLINNTRYEITFFICDMILHFAPLVLFRKYFSGDPNSLFFTLLFVIIYLGFINQKSMNVNEIYLKINPRVSLKDFIHKYLS